ncbi:MAG: hypothetical protein IJX27_06590 [Clostridia bacterium]|nr:hypothetical protein [Clostridia bacterium]
MKIIFLDIDGVLNCDRFIIKNKCRGIGIDPERVALLAEIVRASGAKIVLTTSWRSHWSENPEECDAMGREINEAFAAQGLTVYSKTPRISYVREEEILAWLDENPEATRFVIIDDMYLQHEHLDAYIIRTIPFRGGLCEEDVMEAIKILNGRV